MPANNATTASCPVCGLAAGTAAACPECDWTLRAPRLLGPVTAELRQAFDEGLGRAQRTFDTRVAALISADKRDITQIRGGPPNRAEWAAARDAAAHIKMGALPERTLRGVIADTLRGLDAGADSSCAIAEIDSGGITVTQVGLDRFGSPQLHREHGTVAWTDILPVLSEDADERRFQLAGGISGLDHAWLWRTLCQMVQRLTEDCTLVICRPAGWLIVERAAKMARERRPTVMIVRAVAPEDGTAPGTLLDSMAAEGPLLRGYGIVLAIADPPAGALRAEVRALFEPGDEAGQERVLSLRRAPGDRGDVALAIIVDNGPLQELLLPLSRVPQPRESAYRIRAVLDGPGRVRFIEPAGVVADPRPWPEVRAGLPHRVDVLLGPIDLVCAVELSGTREQVRKRRQLIRDLLEILETEYPEPGRLQVALVGCTDHMFEPGREKRKVAHSTPLGSVGHALATLGKAATGEIRHPDAAPLEDLLHRAVELLSGSHGQDRAARLLLVAGRLPHPYPLGGDNVHPCPHRYDWHAELRRLTGPCAASCVTVADSVPLREARAAAWRELGQAGLHQISATDARQVGEDLRVLVRHAQRIPIPLANLEAGIR